MELWGEGFRFFDLKRINSSFDRTGAQLNATITAAIISVPVDDKRWQLLIPISEINLNSAIEQNPI